MSWGRWLAAFVVVIAAGACACCPFVHMPGASHRGPMPALGARGATLRAQLESDVHMLATTIGERHAGKPQALAKTVEHLRMRFEALGFTVVEQPFTARGERFVNLEVERRGSTKAGEIVVVGAHYDTARGTPGANDNGTGVAALLALAERFADAAPLRTVRFVAYANEEPPFFSTDDMGSRHHAARIQARGEHVVAMWSLETMGSFSDEEGSQHYPFPFGLLYPSRGDFIAFVGDTRSVGLVRDSVELFRRRTPLPSEGASVPGSIPGVGWSDHASYWAIDVPAVMVTDTAPFRYAHYHRGTDVPARIDFDRLTRIVEGLVDVIEAFASPPA
jgi:hypothetical protein